ncbi:MAG: sensor histidine kinase [Sphingomonadaceae bacterium]
MPSSLFTRIVALVLATVAVAQLINMLLLATLAPAPPRTVPVDSLARLIEARDLDALILRRVPSRPLGDADETPTARQLRDALAAELRLEPDDVWVEPGPVQGNRQVSIPDAEGASRLAFIGPFRVALRDAEGGWQLIEPRDQGLFDNRERRFILLFLLSALAMLPAAWAFARRLAEPIEQFADAAERLGRDPTAAPPAIEGPAEVGRAAEALAGMQARLQAYVADRTRMLAAIAHDLRTPLTRLQFRLESLPDGPARTGMSRDIAEMEAMVAATMNLARMESEAGKRQRLELGSLVERVAEDMAMVGRKVSAEAPDALIVEGDPVALRRLIQNLLDNGETYGGRAHARAWRDGDTAVIDVDDEGPGLPPEEMARVFEPFYRLEASRNRATGGTGLGLAVVRSSARAHGGDVTLENRPEGGLRARVRLPLAP